MKNRTWINLLCGILVVGILVYLFHDVFRSNFSAYNTETADETKVQDTLDLQGFVVRDEQYISGETKGTVVPLVSDGNRVASGDSVARICNSDEDAANYSKLLDAKKELKRYKTLSEQTELNALDIEKLNNDIDSRYSDVLSVISSGDYTKLNDSITDLEDKMASKQILSTGSIDLTAKFTELNNTISELEAKNIKTSDVLAPLSGYYISNLDGYENAITYKDVDNITVSEAQSALNAEPTNVSNKMGKIVGSYKWYIVAVTEQKYYTTLYEGRTMRINLPYYGYDDVPVVVEKVSKDDSGKIAVVFSCNMMNEVYANMRIENIEIVLHEYTGYKINSSAIREETDSDGNSISVVYILRGNIMNVRKIEIIYDAGDYVIASEITKAGNGYNPIKRYDAVIVKGRNLSDGKSVS
jgi:hypothetical protein